jgi:signal transduction histidine kinase
MHSIWKRLIESIWRTRKSLALGLALVCADFIIAAIDAITPPEIPIEAFYTLPISLGIWFFGWYMGLGIAFQSILLFLISNYFIGGDSWNNLWPSIILNAILFFLFVWGANQFILNQRNLQRTRRDLQLRISEFEKLYHASQQLHLQNIKLAISEEHNRYAREIHDVLAQGLAAIIFQIEAAEVNYDKPEVLEERLSRISELAHHNLQEARRSVANLNPGELEGNFLSEALEQKIRAFFKETGIDTVFSTSGPRQLLAHEVEISLYRITQEALTNAVRHSQAALIQVSLDFDEEEVCLTIEDNGKGFDPEELITINSPQTPGEALSQGDKGANKRKKFGLTIMEERASLIGGWVSIQSKPGSGCRIRVIVPNKKALSVAGPTLDNIATLPE